jgi:predicted transcriptional regulator
MGQTASVHGPPLRAVIRRRAVLAAFIAALMLAAFPSLSLAEEDAWASLDMADVPVGATIPVVGDTVSFRLHAHWGGDLAGHPVLLVVEPLPEGWTFWVEGSDWFENGFLLHEEGLVVVNVDLGDATEPGTYYVEPRIDHPITGASLTSVPVLLDVPEYFMVPYVETAPDPQVAPGEVLRWTVGVEAGVPVDRLARLELVFAPEGWEVRTEWRPAFVREGRSEPVSFTVVVGGETRPGEYSVAFGVRTSDPRVVTYMTVETVYVPRVVAFDSASTVMQYYGASGWEVSGNLTVTNSGNLPMTVLEVVPDDQDELPPGWRLGGRDLPMVVEPLSERKLEVDLDLPDDPSGSPSGTHVVPISLMTELGVVDIDAELEVHVPYVVSMSITKEPLWTYLSYTELSMTFLVADLGNVVQERAVWLTYDVSPAITRVELSRSTLMMAMGRVEQVVMTAQIDPEAARAPYTISLYASDARGRLAGTTFDVSYDEPRFNLVGDLEVSAVQEEGHYAGDEASVYVVTGRVVNEGDRDLAFAKVEVYDISDVNPVHLGYVPIYDLAAGETRSFRFTLDRVRPGDNTVMAHPSAPGSNGDPYKGSLSSRFEAEAVAPAPQGFAFMFLFGVALGSMAGLVAILATEAGRFALLAFILVPLYTRLKPEQVTDHFIRGQILGYVKANPGETYTHIRKALKLTNGTFVYHARILESQGHIRSVKDGANRRFYPSGMRIPPEVKDVKLNQVQRMIYTIVMEYPGISQAKIAKMVELAPSTVNYHVNIMTKVGVLERKRSGRLSLCFATDEGERT